MQDRRRVHRPRLDELDALTATHARLANVERELAQWTAHDAGTGPRPTGLTRPALEDLRRMLLQVIAEQKAEQEAEAQLHVWQRRN